MPKKTGVCMNVGGCTKARNREIQEADISNFICEECSKPLKEKKGDVREPFWKKYKKQIILVLCLVGIVAVVVLVVLGIPPRKTGGGTGDTIVKPDTITKDTVVGQGGGGGEIPPTPPTNPNELDLGYAIYTGPIVNGKAHGINGEMKITKQHTFDLKDGKGSTIDVWPGDTIKNCKFKNGKFVSGYLHRKDGTQKHINIGV